MKSFAGVWEIEIIILWIMWNAFKYEDTYDYLLVEKYCT